MGIHGEIEDLNMGCGLVLFYLDFVEIEEFWLLLNETKRLMVVVLDVTMERLLEREVEDVKGRKV